MGSTLFLGIGNEPSPRVSLSPTASAILVKLHIPRRSGGNCGGYDGAWLSMWNSWSCFQRYVKLSLAQSFVLQLPQPRRECVNCVLKLNPEQPLIRSDGCSVNKWICEECGWRSSTSIPFNFSYSLGSSVDFFDWQAATCKIKLFSSLLLKVKHTSNCGTGPSDSSFLQHLVIHVNVFLALLDPWLCSTLFRLGLTSLLDLMCLGGVIWACPELAQNVFLKGRENTAAMSGCWTNVMPQLVWKAPLFWNQTW